MYKFFITCLLGAFSYFFFVEKSNSSFSQIDQIIAERWDDYIGQHESLPLPFTISLEEQSHFYYWDVFFTNKGLILHKRFDLAKNNIDNFIYEIQTFGYIPNATASWGYNRSQPPYFSMMVRDFYEANPAVGKKWLKKAYLAALKEYHFWTATGPDIIEDHSTPVPGLQRYSHHASEEELASVYDGIKHRFPNLKPMKEEEKIKFGADIIAECATGMDFTWRFDQRCTDFIAVDLNANLYQYEQNFIWFEEILGLGGENDWAAMAKNRKKLINTYCWDEQRQVFTDYDFVNKRYNPNRSFGMFLPFFWNIASEQQAQALKTAYLPLQSDWGITATEHIEVDYNLQWDGDAIWPPVQLLAEGAFRNYGEEEIARNIGLRYLKLINKNYVNPVPEQYTGSEGKAHERPSGFLWEKYNTQGEINDKDYAAHQMMGWSAGVYVYFFYRYMS
ncbi:hypothetical protein PEDI_49700 [Persicobacter diffluens]|uniref:Trehalase n=2 Tax=Persicobacter diffluens TaxID=981 RepID=A0AAN4W321_9BACT|nr:hypothetical protein PEDI_49700 [Persicobacter diffluens]